MTGLLWAVLGILGGLGMTAVGDMVSEEVRDRLDHLPHAILRLAARRLDPAQRVAVYDGEWLPELAYILKGDEARPVTRLYHGIRYALSIFVAGRRIARQLPWSRTRRDMLDVLATTRTMAIGVDLRDLLEVRGRPTSRAEKAVWSKMLDRLMGEFAENPQTIRPVLARCQGMEINIAELATVWTTMPDDGLLSQALICHVDLATRRTHRE